MRASSDASPRKPCARSGPVPAASRPEELGLAAFARRLVQVSRATSRPTAAFSVRRSKRCSPVPCQAPRS